MAIPKHLSLQSAWAETERELSSLGADDVTMQTAKAIYWRGAYDIVQISVNMKEMHAIEAFMAGNRLTQELEKGYREIAMSKAEIEAKQAERIVGEVKALLDRLGMLHLWDGIVTTEKSTDHPLQ